MWEKLGNIATTLLNLSNEMQRNRDDIRELRDDLDALTDIVRNIAADFKYGRQADQKDKENLVLRLENELLKFERRLPPPKDE